ncbi:duf1746 domain containing protein [Grosmannia clavigera kw1407]|uniref:Duf1746 domain containing protein n=1 Tax=Grosmannia clavigera (strain kw1407 / UAMH 11150) TaxID=655863 RepID=F0XMY1_GROCL|nr:duf1746 domain containing protein [Grosmannia clavigera kw1407]EFX00861.1 duf1746 domain containing protein [Grosmannia clavigera kw1407]
MDDNGSSSRSARPSHHVPQTRPPRPQRPPRSRRSQQPRRPRERTAILPQRSASVMRKVRAGLSKKLKFFTELMGQLDMIVYAELCTLYYMDPKPDEFMLITPAHRPHVLAVVVPNALCMLAHVLWQPLQGTETSRGYLHGGVLIDFVGQRAPSSRWVLFLLDLVVLAVQCLMLAVHTEREKLRKLVLPMKGALALPMGRDLASPALAATTNAMVAAAQDHDAEERGVQRTTGRPAEGGDGIEMQRLGGGDATTENNGIENENENENALLDDRPRRLPPEQAAEYVLNALASGCNLSDFYVVHAIREASQDYQGVAAQSLQTMSYAASLARLAARRGGAGVRTQTTGVQ